MCLYSLLCSPLTPDFTFLIGSIPDEAKALSLLAPANAVAGILPGGGLLPTPNPMGNQSVRLHTHCTHQYKFSDHWKIKCIDDLINLLVDHRKFTITACLCDPTWDCEMHHGRLIKMKKLWSMATSVSITIYTPVWYEHTDFQIRFLCLPDGREPFWSDHGCNGCIWLRRI